MLPRQQSWGDSLAKAETLVSPIMKKYGVPKWVSPFIFSYIKGDPINAIKRGLSFIDVKRRKGEVTKKNVYLPNGYKFDTGSIGAVLNIFLYTENRISGMTDEWLSRPVGHDYLWYKNYFSALLQKDKKHAKAVKNLMDGLGVKPAEAKKELEALFDFIQSIDLWPERLVASEVILKRSYSTFGMVFYRVFYAASPEFMRSFVKVFRSDDESWEVGEIDRIINEGVVGRERMLSLARELLKRFYLAINSYSSIAKKERIEREVKLIMEVAMAHPLQFLNEHGFEIDVEREVRDIEKSAK